MQRLTQTRPRLALTVFALTLGFIAGISAPAAADHHKKMSEGKKDLVDTAKSAGGFETLLTAAKAAGLVDTLKGDGPLTVFAPTDKAFDALPDGALEALLNDKQALREVLLLHVVPGKQMAGKVVKSDLLPTAYGQPIYINASDGGVKVDSASVVKTDVKASNGVIHVIDKVLLPKSITDLVVADERFSTLETAVTTAGLAETLASEGPFTVFAPVNEAFSALPDGTVAELLKPANREKLTDILTYHAASGAVPAADVVELDKVTTLQGGDVPVKVVKKTVNDQTETHVFIGEAKVIIADIKASNGIVHVINAVLLP